VLCYVVYYEGRNNTETSTMGYSLQIMKVRARNGPVYAGIPYQNFFLFLNFIQALVNIYYIHLTFPYFEGISLFRF
jgi:hypothetical protein